MIPTDSPQKEQKNGSFVFSKLFSIGAGLGMVLIIGLFLMRGCGNPSKSWGLDTEYIGKQLAKKVEKQIREVKEAERKAAISQTIAVAGRDRWRTIHSIKLDTLVKRDTVLKIIHVCDSALTKDSIAMTDKDAVIDQYKGLVALKDEIHTNDSTQILSLKKEVRRLKVKVVFWKVVATLEAAAGTAREFIKP